MEKLQKSLEDQEVKVEAGFLQLYRWQEVDRTEREKLKASLLDKVDVAIFKELSEAQKECSNQARKLDDLVIQHGLVQAPTQQIQKELQHKIQSLREDVNAMKLNAAVETQVNRESPPEIFRNPQFCQELEKLIHLEPCNTIQQLEEIVKGIKEELYRTETTLNFFKCEEFPKEVELVKSGLNKVVSDLKDFFGTGRPQKLSNELDTIQNKIDILSSEVQNFKSSTIKDQEDWYSQQKSRIEDAVKVAVNKVSALVPKAKEVEIMSLGNQKNWDDLGQKLEVFTKDLSDNVANLNTLAEEVKTVKSMLIVDNKQIADLQSLVERSTINKEKQSKIEETVELAVKKVGSLVPESKAALSNQVKEETTKLVNQTKLDEFDQKLEVITKEVSKKMENLDCLAEEVENVKIILLQDRKGFEDLQAQVANSTRCEEKYAADLDHQMASIQSRINSSLKLAHFKDALELESPVLKQQVELIRSDMSSRFEVEVQRMKDEIGAIVSEEFRKSQVRLGKVPERQSDIDPSLQRNAQQQGNFYGNAGEDSSKVDAMVISDDDQETTRFQKSNHRARSPLQVLYQDQITQKTVPVPTSSPSYRKGKYFNPGRARKYVGGLKASSVRKDRSQMDARHKDEDQALSLALQRHIRILTSTKRDKSDCLRLATEEDLENLPNLDRKFCHLPLPTNAPYLLTLDQVSLNFSDDEDVRHAFAKYCEQKACQYGLPFVALAIEDSEMACDWNSRTKMFLLDTLLDALRYGEYPECFSAFSSNSDSTRIEKLLDSHLKYQLEVIERSRKDEAFFDSSRKSDRRTTRRLRLAGRRLETCQAVQGLSSYAKLFEDDRLCSSDESMDDPLDEDKIRHTPPWRSQLATLLVNRVDSAYKELRRSEYPKRSGRKPSKRIAPSNPVVSDSTCWPIELPDDCYSQSWLKELEPQHKITLKAREPILGGLSI
ncbi:hypothetical protein PCASD_20226 [Puccinia coronata f. sp. avenae]|uniref:Uncharacterized protein n=1 Tax=Puccinia coronata f. sp. avenae TaxID=200324 RepID=A0A2N5TW16_9BASI|nr:hypothetical protein PCASD_20226 [Puccinia coronata f. sp. avenae]